jgi:hypothetical protein
MDSVVYRRESGSTSLRNLEIGEEVLVPSEASGSLVYDKVISFLHWEADGEYKFLRISHTLGGSVTLHPDHLVSVGSGYKPAASVTPGDSIRAMWIDGSLEPASVTAVEEVSAAGLCCPLTVSGRILVDSVDCSCYSPPTGQLAVPLTHSLCHLAVAPLRIQHSLGRGQTKPPSGIHPYGRALLAMVTGASLG